MRFHYCSVCSSQYIIDMVRFHHCSIYSSQHITDSVGFHQHIVDSVRFHHCSVYSSQHITDSVGFHQHIIDSVGFHRCSVCSYKHIKINGNEKENDSERWVAVPIPLQCHKYFIQGPGIVLLWGNRVSFMQRNRSCSTMQGTGFPS